MDRLSRSEAPRVQEIGGARARPGDRGVAAEGRKLEVDGGKVGPGVEFYKTLFSLIPILIKIKLSKYFSLV
jgi:hypothetical protein